MLINIDWTEKKPPSARPGGTTCWPLWPPAAGTFVSSRASPRLAAPSTHKTNVASSGQKAFEVKELLKNKFSGKEWWKTPRCELGVSGFVFPGWVLSRTGCSFQVLAAFACGLFVLLWFCFVSGLFLPLPVAATGFPCVCLGVCFPSRFPLSHCSISSPATTVLRYL